MHIFINNIVLKVYVLSLWFSEIQLGEGFIEGEKVISKIIGEPGSKEGVVKLWWGKQPHEHSWLQKTCSRGSSATRKEFLTEPKILDEDRKFYEIENKQKLFSVGQFMTEFSIILR